VLTKKIKDLKHAAVREKKKERVDRRKKNLQKKPEVRGGARLGLARNQLVCKKSWLTED
jgi:hypothetical protein